METRVILYKHGVKVLTDYTIDELGNVYSNKAQKEHSLIKPQMVGGNGKSNHVYQFVAIRHNKKSIQSYIHHLMIWSWLDKDFQTEGLKVSHNDLNKMNNSIDNLSLKTHKEIGDLCKELGVKRKTPYKVLQFDLQDNFIREYESVKEAEELSGGNVSSCLRGICYTIKGSKWRYKDEKLNIFIKDISKKHVRNGKGSV